MAAPDTRDRQPIDGRRIISLEGGRNFRDLGGYLTSDGRRVKWGKLFRSGSMAGLTPADYESLATLSIKTVCDLRTIQERQAEPNRWCQVANIRYWAHEHRHSFGELRQVMASGVPTPELARAAMIQGYRRLPFEQAPAHQELFSRLAAGEVPLVFNCSAGKDRAGTAAALILSALGVPRETVVEDYVLTDRVVDLESIFMATARRSVLMSQAPGIVAAVLKADASYLHAALDAVEEKHGTVAAYLQDALGITEKVSCAIRESLLE
ncbi:MAG: tyrosine-protein phosphatase [Steroidobacteraceae bacterium]